MNQYRDVPLTKNELRSKLAEALGVQKHQVNVKKHPVGLFAIVHDGAKHYQLIWGFSLLRSDDAIEIAIDKAKEIWANQKRPENSSKVVDINQKKDAKNG